MNKDTLRSVAILAAGAIIGSALIAAFEHYRADFDAWVRQDLHSRGRLVMVALIVMTSGPLLGMGIYCWRLARTKGPFLRIAGAVSGGAGLLLAVLLWRFLLILEQTRS